MSRTSLLTAFLLTACGSETDLETAFCDILSASDASATATTSPADAPTVVLDDASATVALLGGAAPYRGFVAYEVDEDGSFVFGLSDNVGLWLTDSDGTRLQPVSEVGGSDCADLAARSTWDLSIGTWYLEFESNVPGVTVTAEESDDDL